MSDDRPLFHPKPDQAEATCSESDGESSPPEGLRPAVLLESAPILENDGPLESAGPDTGLLTTAAPDGAGFEAAEPERDGTAGARLNGEAADLRAETGLQPGEAGDAALPGAPDAAQDGAGSALVAAAETANDTGAALRERSLSPPGPLSDRYLGCTIDNRYKVEGIVGEGGMGVVYQCRHKIIDKRVALKILRADLARDAEVTERFLMEAKAASAIQDEHIISISDFGQLPDGAAYFVMEFLDGTPLAQVAGGGRPVPITRILPIARQLAEGLGAAHQRGIIHRDLKPDNVFLIQRGKETDFVKILDFGIAKVTSTGSGRLTQVGSVFGTPHYMSPEQAAAAPLDHRGDIYSLGVMLYELATGRVPFDAENFVGILSQHLYQEPLPPRAAAPEADIPFELEAIITKCMAKKPEHRYQSMLQLRDELWQLEKRLRRHQTPSSAPLPVIDPAASVDGTALSTELTLASLRPRRWPLYAAIAAPVSIVLAFLAVRFGSLKADSPVPGPTPPAIAQRPPAPAAPASEPPTPPAAHAAAAPAPKQVLIGVAPTTAHVFLDGRDLGQSPVSVEVPAGAPLEVEVRHPDYVSKSLKLDGTRERVAIELEPKPRKRHKLHGKSKRSAADGAERPLGDSAESTSSRAAPRGTSRRAVRPKAPPAAGPVDESIGGQLFVEPWQKP